MKKPRFKAIARLKRLNVYKRYRKKSHILILRSKRKGKLKTIKFSNKFSLFYDVQRDLIIDLLSYIKFGNSSKCYIDFKYVKELNPLTVLFLIQNLDKFNDAKFSARNFEQKMHRAVFRNLKLNKYFGLPNVDNVSYNKFVDEWRLFEGEKLDFSTELQQHFSYIKSKFGDNPKISITLISGIIEALGNVVNHAYDNENYCKWFLLTHIDEKSVTVVVSDLGLTIPVTTPRTIRQRISEKIFTLTTFVNDFNSYFIGSKAKPLVVDTDSDELKGLSDSQLIRVATRLNNSRTGEAGRGKGFNDILELGVNANKYPEIQKINTSILSRFGSYIIVSDGTNGVKETSYRE